MIDPAQMLKLPDIGAVVLGALITVTVILVVAPEPHALFGFTVIIPPEEPAVTLIELVVDEPVQPEGNVHVYDVTLGSLITE